MTSTGPRSGPVEGPSEHETDSRTSTDTTAATGHAGEVKHGIDGPSSPSHDAEKSLVTGDGPNTTPTRANLGTAGDTTGSESEVPSAAKEPEAQRTRLETAVIVLALASGLFLAALDMTIITTAIPTISAQFESPLGYTWIGSAYLLANAAVVPFWGKISDIWGRKPIILVAVAIFWIGSLLCGLSVNMGMLIGARAVQGAGGGGIIVLVNISISDLFSLRTRGVYYGMMGLVWAIASAVGPVLGGVFTSQVSWRWCFWVNLPISGVGFIVLFFVLSLHNPRTSLKDGLAALDWFGSLFIIGGTLMFLFGLEFGGITYPWNSAPTICLLVFGIATIGLFVAVEKWYAKYPIIPLRLFTDRSNIVIFLVSFCHAAVFMSGSYWLPLYFQAVLRATSLQSGLYILPYMVVLSISSICSGVYIRKSGKYSPAIISGMALTTLGFGLYIDLDAHSSWAKIVLYQIVAGVGIGPNFQAPLIGLQSTVEPRDVASATSTFAFIRQLATSTSVVIGGVLFQNSMQNQYPRLLAELGPDLAHSLSGGNAAGSVNLVASLDGTDGEIARGAFAQSLRNMYIFYTCLAALGMALTPLIKARVLTKEHTEHKTGLQTLRKRGDPESSPSVPTRGGAGEAPDPEKAEGGLAADPVTRSATDKEMS
ncbi:major facilitator superfamily domain-containing protein [Microdochium trichocladiopsis]|uniref:Efflux pump dotC n=1 Tax=Microdochium trichocladiopsis TaxID=1682393 RepID=A0A9P8YB92_9PEZI|nr:major facilitator superfamily domain-containing protein [Microdochium trichocladiopsis]KAH7034700.1 major facilitator superfamily domain-containing protein [Microdochium trichocladiopsis]